MVKLYETEQGRRDLFVLVAGIVRDCAPAEGWDENGTPAVEMFGSVVQAINERWLSAYARANVQSFVRYRSMIGEDAIMVRAQATDLVEAFVAIGVRFAGLDRTALAETLHALVSLEMEKARRF